LVDSQPASTAFISANPEELEAVFQPLAERVLPRLGAWALRVIEALPEPHRACFGWRDYVHGCDGLSAEQSGWCYPRANAAERIEVYLWLAERLNDGRYRDAAEHCGRALVDDPWFGIYQGDEADGRGQVWYWREIGTYMTNYTMRVPSAMLELAAATGEAKYERAAHLCGEQLLHSQHPTGVLRAGWHPAHPSPDGPALTPEQAAQFLPPDNINIRFAYVARAFADMDAHTNDARYLQAMERMTHALQALQNEDGSFPANVKCETIGVNEATIKGHFLHYMLNGLVPALLRKPPVAGLEQITRRLAEFLLHRLEHTWATPYGDPTNFDQAGKERQHWLTGRADPAYGLARLAEVTGDTRYRAAALQLVIAGMMRCVDWPDQPDLHGGVPHRNLDSDRAPRVGSHYHFWLLMGLRALEQTAP